jgi:ferrous iron transport protein A
MRWNGSLGFAGHVPDELGSRSTVPLTLDALDPRVPASVVDIVSDALERARWLNEIGFVPGEPLMVMIRAYGGDPLVVRIGASTFALRRSEAACVRVLPAT